MARRETTARYREKNREVIRAKGRAQAAAKRRADGMPALGTPESTENRRRARKLTGPDHPNWKGDAAGYTAHHHWIRRWGQRTGSCAHCGGQNKPGTFRAVRTDWANISGHYLRDLDDWLELCTSCHQKFDRARGGDES